MFYVEFIEVLNEQRMYFHEILKVLKASNLCLVSAVEYSPRIDSLIVYQYK